MVIVSIENISISSNFLVDIS